MKIVSARILALLCALVVAAACGTGSGVNDASGGSGGTSSTGTATAPPTSSSGTSSGAPTSSATPGGGGSGGTSGQGGSGSGGGGTSGGGGGGGGGGNADGDSGFAWVPFGPSDPNSPPPVQWYDHVENYSCELDGNLDPLWTSVLALCEVVVNKDKSKWNQVEHVAGTGHCLDDLAAALLDRALAWHKAHPDQLPVVKSAGKGGRAACPPEIKKVQLQDADGNPVDGKLEGPTSGQTILVLTVDGLTSDAKFMIGKVRVTGETSGDAYSVTLTTPKVEKAGKVSITFENKYGKAEAASKFTYTDPTDQQGGGGDQQGGGTSTGSTGGSG